MDRRTGFLLLLAILLLLFLCSHSHGRSHSRFVIILAANQGGGVMTWKGAKEWALERESIKNKRDYVKRHGYELAVRDMSVKKRYAHEWRESWEKVDTIKSTMRQHPHAEWFWWLDLHTIIMEPQVSLEDHIFSRLDNVTYQDISIYNPLNMTIDGDAPVPQAAHLLASQDCGGFNLGSFFVRRGEWTDRLLDFWWDPVFYEQKHMEWEHKEQDALEYLYSTQSWIRASMYFMPQRMINSFPPGACAEQEGDTRIFYNESDRDFIVNMAGCEWGRDCYGEMKGYEALSQNLNRPWWKRLLHRRA